MASAGPPCGRRLRRSTSSARCGRCSTWATEAARWRQRRTARVSAGSRAFAFSALAFTNLSRDHLDFHGTLEEYFAAKRSLFVTDDPPPAALNTDDDHGRRLADELRALGQERLVTFGFGADADIRAEGLDLRDDGASFTAAGIPLRTRLLGRFNVENALAAVAVARLLELPDDAISQGIEAVRGVPGRFEAVNEGQAFSVVVDYAHTPDSLENALRTARELATGNVVCVFGCGGDRDHGKRPLMGEAAERGADVVIVTSDNPRSEAPEAIAAEVTAGLSMDVIVELDRAKAIELAVEQAQPGDLVLIAGKGHEQGQEAAGETTPFDDRDVAREALRRLAAAMIPLDLDEVEALCPGRLVRAAGKTAVTGVVIDSRRVSAGRSLRRRRRW